LFVDFKLIIHEHKLISSFRNRNNRKMISCEIHSIRSFSWLRTCAPVRYRFISTHIL